MVSKALMNGDFILSAIFASKLGSSSGGKGIFALDFANSSNHSFSALKFGHHHQSHRSQKSTLPILFGRSIHTFAARLETHAINLFIHHIAQLANHSIAFNEPLNTPESAHGIDLKASPILNHKFLNRSREFLANIPKFFLSVHKDIATLATNAIKLSRMKFTTVLDTFHANFKTSARTLKAETAGHTTNCINHHNTCAFHLRNWLRAETAPVTIFKTFISQSFADCQARVSGINLVPISSLWLFILLFIISISDAVVLKNLLLSFCNAFCVIVSSLALATALEKASNHDVIFSNSLTVCLDSIPISSSASCASLHLSETHSNTPSIAPVASSLNEFFSSSTVCHAIDAYALKSSHHLSTALFSSPDNTCKAEPAAWLSQPTDLIPAAIPINHLASTQTAFNHTRLVARATISLSVAAALLPTPTIISQSSLNHQAGSHTTFANLAKAVDALSTVRSVDTLICAMVSVNESISSLAIPNWPQSSAIWDRSSNDIGVRSARSFSSFFSANQSAVRLPRLSLNQSIVFVTPMKACS